MAEAAGTKQRQHLPNGQGALVAVAYAKEAGTQRECPDQCHPAPRQRTNPAGLFAVQLSPAAVTSARNSVIASGPLSRPSTVLLWTGSTSHADVHVDMILGRMSTTHSRCISCGLADGCPVKSLPQAVLP